MYGYMAPSQTNTGKKNMGGRTIWRGARGGHFILINGKKSYVKLDQVPGPLSDAERLAGQMARMSVHPNRARPEPTFTDPVTLEVHPQRDGVLLNKQWYHKDTMKQVAMHGNYRVPHSRRMLTLPERAALGIYREDSYKDREDAMYAEQVQFHDSYQATEDALLARMPPPRNATEEKSRRAQARSRRRAMLQRLDAIANEFATREMARRAAAGPSRGPHR